MRPLNLGETLDASIKIVRARWRTLATVMLVIALPIQIASVLIISSTTDVYQAGSAFSTSTAAKTTYGNEGAYVAGQTAIIALGILGYLLGTVACYRAVAATYLSRPTSARESLGYATDRLGATLWLTIVLVVGLAGALIALILPFFWLAVAWSVAYPVMLVEGIGGVGALRRSFSLTQGRWWATLARLLVAYILVMVLSTVVAGLSVSLPAALGLDDTSFWALALEHAGDFVASLATTPFIAAVTTLVYFDLRVRKEGFDPALLDGGPPRAGAEGELSPEQPARRWGDAFGQPVPPPRAPDVPPAPPAPPAPAPPPAEPAPGSWAPPVAPEPRRPPQE